MFDIRKRNIGDSKDDKEDDKSSDIDDSINCMDDTGDASPPSGDDDDIITPNFSDNGQLCQASDDTTDSINSALKDLPPRWRNWVVRGIFSTIMISSFCFIVYLGPLALVALIFLVQIKCFHEIITIGYVVYKSHELPWFRTLSWYFLLASNYFFYGESMIQYFGVLLSRTEFLSNFVTYHRFIAFTLYCGGFVAFVFSLVKKHYLKQFTLISSMLLPFDSVVCPIGYDVAREILSNECERDYVFRSAEYMLPSFVIKTISIFGCTKLSIQLYPFLLHSISLSVFASIIGPFGGFFASGFKRAFKIKDFGDTIPGHGGFMDRFDCQLLMATFVHVYQSSFIKAAAPQRLIQQVLSLKPEDQLHIFKTLNETMRKSGILT